MVIYVRTPSLTKRLRAAATGTSGSPNKMVTERNGLDSWVHILLFSRTTCSEQKKFKIFMHSVLRRIRQSRSRAPLGALKGVNRGSSRVCEDVF